MIPTLEQLMIPTVVSQAYERLYGLTGVGMRLEFAQFLFNRNKVVFVHNGILKQWGDDYDKLFTLHTPEMWLSTGLFWEEEDHAMLTSLDDEWADFTELLKEQHA